MSNANCGSGDCDYWFSLGQCCCKCCRNSNCRRCRPVFPRVVQANLVIPQTSIPIQVVFGGQTGINTGSLLQQSISLSPNTITPTIQL